MEDKDPRPRKMHQNVQNGVDFRRFVDDGLNPQWQPQVKTRAIEIWI